MNQVRRTEKKYLLPQWEFYVLKNRLEQLLHADVHNGLHGYTVRSLYFDTIDGRDYYEKEDGVDMRRKIRLRCYGADAAFALLEVKQKQGDLQWKRSLRVEKEDALRLARGDYRMLREVRGRDKTFAAECYGILSRFCYRPWMIVEYARIAYMTGGDGVRITMDQKLSASGCVEDLFSQTLLCSPVMDASSVILEVKYDRFLPDYVTKLLRIEQPEISLSKYCLARGLLK